MLKYHLILWIGVWKFRLIRLGFQNRLHFGVFLKINLIWIKWGLRLFFRQINLNLWRLFHFWLIERSYTTEGIFLLELISIIIVLIVFVMILNFFRGFRKDFSLFFHFLVRRAFLFQQWVLLKYLWAGGLSTLGERGCPLAFLFIFLFSFDWNRLLFVLKDLCGDSKVP